MVIGYFIFLMAKLKQKENSEMARELENGDIIMSLVELSRYQGTQSLVREMVSGLNMMKMEKS